MYSASSVETLEEHREPCGPKSHPRHSHILALWSCCSYPLALMNHGSYLDDLRPAASSRYQAQPELHAAFGHSLGAEDTVIPGCSASTGIRYTELH